MNPAVKFWPEALAEMSQSAFGIDWSPPLSYGPCTLSLIGPFNCLTPSSLTETSRSIRALLIGVEKALSSVALASLELPLPHAVARAALSARTTSKSGRKVRDIGGSLLDRL